MSSNRPTDAVSEAGWRDRVAGLSLRTRLIATILALMALVCVVIGVVTTLFMRERLIGQLDHQLTAADVRHRNLGDPYNPGNNQPDRQLPPAAPGQLSGHIGGAQPASSVIDANGVEHQLTADQVTALAAVRTDGSPHSVSLGALGDYRVVAAADRSPDGGVLVTGLPLGDVQDAVTTLVIVEICVAAGGLLLAGAAGTAIVRINLRPLRRVAATAARVAELPLSQGEVDLSVRVPDVDTDPRTEVGQVGGALNRLLGHVGDALAVRHASETRVRQFVADASHELRTPLAAIRGYAELTRRSRDATPPDVAHALERVESASARMTTLVDDLLLLARLDSGRPLAQDPVDLSRLAVDAMSDAHAAGLDHRWLLNLPDEAVTVAGDGARLHQVFANLLANARTHTPPGTTVTADLSTVDGWAVFTVTDDGPGIPAQLQPEVFERFARGDTSRSRAAGSTGLGLAIVAAVVDSHRGGVAVTSRPGHTSFIVRLPATL
jgi:two-component system, OmpR family, sensor kinase